MASSSFPCFGPGPKGFQDLVAIGIEWIISAQATLGNNSQAFEVNPSSLDDTIAGLVIDLIIS
jgi:hypothetical protein